MFCIIKNCFNLTRIEYLKNPNVKKNQDPVSQDPQLNLLIASHALRIKTANSLIWPRSGPNELCLTSYLLTTQPSPRAEFLLGFPAIHAPGQFSFHSSKPHVCVLHVGLVTPGFCPNMSPSRRHSKFCNFTISLLFILTTLHNSYQSLYPIKLLMPFWYFGLIVEPFLPSRAHAPSGRCCG